MFRATELHHFTSLMNLPPILREGIKRGEVPVPNVPYNRRPMAVNLTRNPDRRAQDVWNLGPTDKSRVRFLVDLPPNMIVRFKEACKRHNIRASWIKQLAPGSQHIDWFFYYDEVPVDRILRVDVALEPHGPCVTVQGQTLEALVEIIDNERNKLEFGVDWDGVETMRPANLEEDTWLFDGPELWRPPPTVDLKGLLAPKSSNC